MKTLSEFKSHQPLEKGKYAQIRKWINEWLEDQSVYCNGCGTPYFPDINDCCDNPQIGKNFDHLWAVIVQNKARQSIRLNDLGSTPSNFMLIGMSIPEDLLRYLEKRCREELGEKLWTDAKDFHRFLRAFPQFMVCKKI